MDDKNADSNKREPKIFTRLSEDEFLLIKQNELFQCQVLKQKKNSHLQDKPLKFGIYDNFIILAQLDSGSPSIRHENNRKNKGILKMKIAYYQFQYFIKFKQHPGSSKLFSFAIHSSAEKQKFFVQTHHEIFQIYSQMKKKMNIWGFGQNYKFIKQIGCGYFSKVFLIQNLIDNGDFAAKVVYKSFLQGKTKGIEALQNEIEILRSIDHPNLVKLECVFEDEKSYFLIFELFRGGSVREFLRDSGAFSENQASLIMRPVLEGIKYLHKHNIMHRDIKLENILLRSKEFEDHKNIVLADFGLATKNNIGQYLHGRCGTPGFVAPEVYLYSDPNDHYDLKTDLFGVGVSLFEMMTGSLPYPGKRSIQSENRKQLFDFSKMEKLSPIAQDLLKSLVCSKEKRLDIFQTLNHEFFKLKCSDWEENWDEPLSTDRHISILENNILGFNSRKLMLQDKNLLILRPCSSPFKKTKLVDQDSTSNCSISYGMTIHSIKCKEQATPPCAENIKSADERKAEFTINTTFTQTKHFNLLNELFSEFDAD